MITNKKPKISVVIAAYNEETRIANVLKIVAQSDSIDEVIVVNDGSKDKTSEVVKKFNATLIDNIQNIGKTLSIKKGIEASKNELIMLIDADLIGFNAESIERLIKPVLKNQVDWTLSIRGNSFSFIRILKLTKVDWLSGERVIPKALLSDPLIWSRPDIGYGLETLMNKSLLARKKTFQSVYLPGVINPEKSEKIGLWRGVMKQSSMVLQISKIMLPHQVLMQFIKMVYLNKKYSKK